jgi:hypothetical protein
MGIEHEATAADGDAGLLADEQMDDAAEDSTPDASEQPDTIQQPPQTTTEPSELHGATEPPTAVPNIAQGASIEHAGDSTPQHQTGRASPEPAVPVRRVRAARANAPRVFVGAGQAWADEKGWLNEAMWRAMVERVVSLVISNPGIPEDLLLGQLQVLTLLQAKELLVILKQSGLLRERIITATSQTHLPLFLGVRQHSTKVMRHYFWNASRAFSEVATVVPPRSAGTTLS